MSSADIGKAIGRARRTVDGYIADLRAATQMGTDIKILCMHRLGIPQDRIAKQMGINQTSIHNHLLKMATLPNLINADLVRGFTVAQVAQKHGWPDPMAGGGVTPDTCLAMGRRCWAFDIDAALQLNDLRKPPGNRLEALERDRKGEHSIRINDQWRICLKWKDGDAHDAEITDYH